MATSIDHNAADGNSGKSFVEMRTCQYTRISQIDYVSTAAPGVTFLRWKQEYYTASVEEHRYLDVKVYGRYEVTVSIAGFTVGTQTDLLPHMIFIDGYKYF